MRFKHSKGIVLILAVGLIFILSLSTVVIFTMLRLDTSRALRWIDATKAYYLCEAGISMALIDIRNGTVPVSKDKVFAYRILGEPSEAFDIYYRIEEPGPGRTKITAAVQSPFNLKTKESIPVPPVGAIWNNVYILEAGGRRAFPIFILDRPGG
ncbi:MAG: hypothetical protein AB1629_00365 [Candidatus Omnitrophota bacterium]